MNIVQPRRTQELGVVVRIDHFIAAIPIRFVARLALASALEVRAEGSPALVEEGGMLHAGWDLDAMFGLPSAKKACILLALPHHASELPIALTTGPCLAVEAIPRATRLPASALGERGAAVVGAFRSTSAAAGADTSFGVVLDPTKLFSTRELDLSAALLRSERRS